MSFEERRTYLTPVMVKAYCSVKACQGEVETSHELAGKYVLRCTKCKGTYVAKFPYPYIEYKEVENVS